MMAVQEVRSCMPYSSWEVSRHSFSTSSFLSAVGATSFAAARYFGSSLFNSCTVGVNIKFPYRTVYRLYRTFKKRLVRLYSFILLGVTQYYCYTRSEYRAESSFKWIFLLCLYRCCSSRLFLTRPFRSSLSIVSALLVD